jgi:hypothetical protein
MMATLLFRHGRLSREALRAIGVKRLVAFRQPPPAPGAAGVTPPWARPGAFRTWARAGRAPCALDVVVNLNVLALLACAGLARVPGRAEALAMVEDALDWTGESPARAAAIAPFYPAAGELVLALAHAVAQGEQALAPALARVRASPMWRALAWASARDAAVIAGSPYGLWTWTCPAVGEARRAHASVAGALGLSRLEQRRVECLAAAGMQARAVAGGGDHVARGQRGQPLVCRPGDLRAKSLELLQD